MQIWPTAKATLDSLIASGGPLPELWVAGHSMGSAVGKLLAYAAQDYLNKQLGAEVGAGWVSVCVGVLVRLTIVQAAPFSCVRVCVCVCVFFLVFFSLGGGEGGGGGLRFAFAPPNVGMVAEQAGRQSKVNPLAGLHLDGCCSRQWCVETCRKLIQRCPSTRIACPAGAAAQRRLLCAATGGLGSGVAALQGWPAPQAWALAQRSNSGLPERLQPLGRTRAPWPVICCPDLSGRGPRPS